MLVAYLMWINIIFFKIDFICFCERDWQRNSLWSFENVALEQAILARVKFIKNNIVDTLQK